MPVTEAEVVFAAPEVLARLLMEWSAPARKGKGARLPAPSNRDGTPQLQSGAGAPRFARVPQKEAASVRDKQIPEPAQRHPPRGRVCSCRTCTRCRDNARWNKIFAEKFADPSYYDGIFTRHDSALSGV
jgi:hypothetical protein